VRVHRTGDVAAAVRTQQDAIFGTILRNRPHGRNAGRIHLDIVHPAGLGGDVNDFRVARKSRAELELMSLCLGRLILSRFGEFYWSKLVERVTDSH
jgi:hypothetical protein